jgi:hypothetical protein
MPDILQANMPEMLSNAHISKVIFLTKAAFTVITLYVCSKL